MGLKVKVIGIKRENKKSK